MANRWVEHPKSKHHSTQRRHQNRKAESAEKIAKNVISKSSTTDVEIIRQKVINILGNRYVKDETNEKLPRDHVSESMLIAALFAQAVPTCRRDLIKAVFELITKTGSTIGVRSSGASKNYSPFHLLAFPNKDIPVSIDELISLAKFLRDDLKQITNEGIITLPLSVFDLNSKGEAGFCAIYHNKRFSDDEKFKFASELLRITNEQAKIIFHQLNKLTDNPIKKGLLAPQIMVAIMTNPEMCAKILVNMLTTQLIKGINYNSIITSYISLIIEIVTTNLACIDNAINWRDEFENNLHFKLNRETKELENITNKMKKIINGNDKNEKVKRRNDNDLKKLKKDIHQLELSIASIEKEIKSVDRRFENFSVLKNILSQKNDENNIRMHNLSNFIEIFKNTCSSTEQNWLHELPTLHEQFMKAKNNYDDGYGIVSNDSNDNQLEFLRIQDLYNKKRDAIRHMACINAEMSKHQKISQVAYVGFIFNKGKITFDPEFDVYRLLHFYCQAKVSHPDAWTKFFTHPQLYNSNGKMKICFSVEVEKILKNINTEQKKKKQLLSDENKKLKHCEKISGLNVNALKINIENLDKNIKTIDEFLKKSFAIYTKNTNIEIKNVVDKVESEKNLKIDTNKIDAMFSSRLKNKCFTDIDADDLCYSFTKDVLENNSIYDVVYSLIYNYAQSDESYRKFFFKVIKMLVKYEGVSYVDVKKFCKSITKDMIADIKVDKPKIDEYMIEFFVEFKCPELLENIGIEFEIRTNAVCEEVATFNCTKECYNDDDDDDNYNIEDDVMFAKMFGHK
uniref:Uncharacterized protein n=1 Tax=viral metagenome TaxID=1070528 RepID=A0A6C0ACB4_9ZZZZ